MPADPGALHIDGVAKSFGATDVLSGIDVLVGEGEFVSLLGPSGCGKTTTLNIVAGFVSPDAGRVVLGGTDITDAPPYRRNTAVVFQDYALFPHMRVTDNVGYGLKARKVPKAEVERRVDETLRLVGIDTLADRYPPQLSGGQQQRVAVARAVATRPAVLLMDEPLSNLDARLRLDIRVELRALQRRLGQSVLFVTHDQEEALSLSDRIVVMNEGAIEQVGTPQDVFERPATAFVADFMGVENILRGEVMDDHWVSTEGLALPVPDDPDARVLGLRPSSVRLRAPGWLGEAPDEAALAGVVTACAYHGDSVRASVRVGASDVVVTVPKDELPSGEGENVTVVVRARDLLPLRDPQNQSRGSTSNAVPQP